MESILFKEISISTSNERLELIRLAKKPTGCSTLKTEYVPLNLLAINVNAILQSII